MPDPLVSIVLPTYDRLPLLRESVDSVRAQTFAGWELIVLDDGSADGTAEYLAEVSREDPRIRPVILPHTGNLPRLRNTGVAHARGVWVAFQDSDDTWREDKLELQLAAHAANPRARWSYTYRTLMDVSGAFLPNERFRRWHPQEGWIMRRLLVHEAMVAVPSMIAERELILAAGGLDETLPFCADYGLQLRLAVRAECAVVSEPLVRVRLHAGSRTRGRVEVNESFMRVYRDFAATADAPDVRRICRHQQAFYATYVARQRWRVGEWWKALCALLFALRMRPLGGDLWGMIADRLARGGKRAGEPHGPRIVSIAGG